MQSCRIKTTNSTRPSPKENSASESKSNTGRVNITKSKDSTQTSKVNLRKKKLFGKASLTSLKSKKIKPRRTTRMHSNNSNKLWINFKSHKTKTSRSMNKTKV